jgi:hypothetical protein
MGRKFLIAACAAALACANAAAAAPASRPARVSTSVQDTAARVQAWAVSLQRWAAPYRQVLLDSASTIGELNDGVLKALEFYKDKKTSEGAEWARTWGQAERAKLRALATRLDEVRKAPMPRLSGIDPKTDATVGALMSGVSRYPDLAAQGLADNEAASLPVIDLIERTAGGDAEAAPKLARSIFTINIAALRSENALLQAAKTMLPEASRPQRDVIDSGVHINLALMAVMESARADAFGEPTDAKAVAAVVRQHAEGVDVAAESAKRDAGAMIARLETVAGFSATPLYQMMIKAKATYAEGSELDHTVANGLRQAAAKLDSDGRASDEVLKILEGLAPLLEKRVQIVQSRAALLSGA